MTSAAEFRDATLVREELTDLPQFLNELPQEIRGTGAFTAYDQRAAELSRELLRQIGDDLKEDQFCLAAFVDYCSRPHQIV